jgi:hypothetical protein
MTDAPVSFPELPRPAMTETEVGLAIPEGAADAGLGEVRWNAP